VTDAVAAPMFLPSKTPVTITQIAKTSRRIETTLSVPRAPRAKKPRALDPQMSAQLLLQYEPLVRKIAGGFQRKLPRNVLREDLIAAGMSGLWDAIRRHPDGPTDSFEWYVRVRVRGAPAPRHPQARRFLRRRGR